MSSRGRRFVDAFRKTQDADKAIMKVLKERKVLIAFSQLMHSYPFCWR